MDRYRILGKKFNSRNFRVLDGINYEYFLQEVNPITGNYNNTSLQSYSYSRINTLAQSMTGLNDIKLVIE